MSLPEGEVAFDVFGGGPPVVLVHGTPSRSYVWRSVVPALAERHAVYVFDLLGFGESEKGEGLDTSIPAQSRVLAGLLGRWGLEALEIAGHDIGGAIVLRNHLLDGVPFGRSPSSTRSFSDRGSPRRPGTSGSTPTHTARCPTTSSSRP